MSTCASLHASSRRHARGYTFVELLMSLAILSIGVTGIVAMQKVTVTSNQHAKNLALATEIGEAWMDQLRADAVGWNHPSALRQTSDITTDTVWLGSVDRNNVTWIRPAWNATRAFGPGFDAQGAPLDISGSVAGVRFCTHIRLSWLYPSNATMLGNGLIRAEVRVFWLREGQAAVGDSTFCAETAPQDVGAATDRYHFVYNTSAIRQNTAQ